METEDTLDINDLEDDQEDSGSTDPSSSHSDDHTSDQSGDDNLDSHDSHDSLHHQQGARGSFGSSSKDSRRGTLGHGHGHKHDNSASSSSSANDSHHDHVKGFGNSNQLIEHSSHASRGKGKPTVSFNEVTNVLREPGAYEALATPIRDRLTGATGEDATFFKWANLTDSLLKGTGNRVLIDEVVGFTTLKDGLDAPDSITTQEINNLSGNVRKLDAGLINSKGVGGVAFAPNTAAAFTCNNVAGVYVVFNDGRPGYQQASDTLIYLKDYAFAPIGIY